MRAPKAWLLECAILLKTAASRIDRGELAERFRNGVYDGMKSMTHRTTFALDQETAKRLKRLAVWQVSQAEVVRRAVALAEQADASEQDPSARLREIHA
ncbi:MAG: hypothetical protein ACI9TH_002653 [Kiritimatiellia bacterium]